MARRGMVQSIYQAFIHHTLPGQHVLELDDGKAAMVVIPVDADEHNVVAPGYGIFAQIKPSGLAIPEPPTGVLNLSHIKARRLEGRSYLYIWALGVNPDGGLNPKHREAYWRAMVNYVMGVADARDLPVVTEVTTEAAAERFEAVGGDKDPKGGFKRIEVLEVASATGGEALQWYTLVRPPKSMRNPKDPDAQGFAMCEGRRGPGKKEEERSGASLFERTHSQQHHSAIGLEDDEEDQEGQHDMEVYGVSFCWVDPHGQKFTWTVEHGGHRGGITDRNANPTMFGKGEIATF